MKITEYPSYSALTSSDLLLIVSNVNVDPASKKIKIKDFFGNISSNTSITSNFTLSGNFTVSGNTYTVNSSSVAFNKIVTDNLKINSDGFIISQKSTPPNSGVSEPGTEGKISFDENYLYVKTSNNSIKRIELSSF